VAAPLPTASGSEERYFLVDAWARYAAAFGIDAVSSLRAGTALAPRPAADVVPAAISQVALTQRAARREILGRWLALAGPVSVDDVRARYDFDAKWIQRRLEDWERSGMLVQGVFGGDRAAPRWASRRLLEQARRRELARARQQIEAVPLPRFARFLQRWQHLTLDTQLSDTDGTAAIVGQLYGLARPAEGWERDYLPARVDGYDADALGRLAASGALVWAAQPREEKPGAAPSQSMGRIRFFARGTGRLWLGAPADDGALSANARAVHDALRAQGASFTAELSAATALGSQALRDALRELVAAGLVTNDTVEALRDVLRWKPVFPIKRPNEPDPTRWLPADFTPSANRPIVQRRVNPRRIAKWRRPDLQETAAWGGRWSLVHTPGTLGREQDEQQLAEQVARQWLARYGIVSRDWWRRERPAVGWREIYHELKRLEFRGEVQRGYFVAGLAGAQFALPEAVELLRSASASDAAPVVMSTSDPANVYTLPLAPGTAADPMARPRGAGALLVTIEGRIVLTAEGRGARLRTAEGATPAEVGAAARAVAERLTAHRGALRQRDIVVDTIDGERAASSRWRDAMRDAGFRSMGTGLRYYVQIQ
jgi:ATP-dependent Lhr-like helicase